MEKIQSEIHLSNSLKQSLVNYLLQSTLLIKKMINLKETYSKKKYHLKNKGNTKFNTFFNNSFQAAEKKIKRFFDGIFQEITKNFLTKFGIGENEEFINFLVKLNDEDIGAAKKLIHSDFEFSWILSKGYIREKFDLLKPIENEKLEEDDDNNSDDSEEEENIEPEKKIEICEEKEEIEENYENEKKFEEVEKINNSIFEENSVEKSETSVNESISIIELLEKHKIVTKSYKVGFEQNHPRNFKK